MILTVSEKVSCSVQLSYRISENVRVKIEGYEDNLIPT